MSSNIRNYLPSAYNLPSQILLDLDFSAEATEIIRETNATVEALRSAASDASTKIAEIITLGFESSTKTAAKMTKVIGEHVYEMSACAASTASALITDLTERSGLSRKELLLSASGFLVVGGAIYYYRRSDKSKPDESTEENANIDEILSMSERNQILSAVKSCSTPKCETPLKPLLVTSSVRRRRLESEFFNVKWADFQFEQAPPLNGVTPPRTPRTIALPPSPLFKIWANDAGYVLEQEYVNAGPETARSVNSQELHGRTGYDTAEEDFSYDESPSTSEVSGTILVETDLVNQTCGLPSTMTSPPIPAARARSFDAEFILGGSESPFRATGVEYLQNGMKYTLVPEDAEFATPPVPRRIAKRILSSETAQEMMQTMIASEDNTVDEETCYI